MPQISKIHHSDPVYVITTATKRSSASISLFRRDWSDGYWETSNSARWAFFAIFIVLIIIIVLGTIRVNQKRAKHGVQPIYGTRWMTPPSYRQSQTAYDQPDHVRDPDLPSSYVPTYTATANENDYDMGFYDSKGVFHRNPNAKSGLNMGHGGIVQQPDEVYARDGGASGTNRVTDESTGATYLSSSFNANHQPSSTNTGTGTGTGTNNNNYNAHSDDDLGDISRPTGPPPGRTSTSISLSNGANNRNIAAYTATEERTSTGVDLDSDTSFQRPSGPPPPQQQQQQEPLQSSVSSSSKNNDVLEKTVDVKN